MYKYYIFDLPKMDLPLKQTHSLVPMVSVYDKFVCISELKTVAMLLEQ